MVFYNAVSLVVIRRFVTLWEGMLIGVWHVDLRKSRVRCEWGNIWQIVMMKPSNRQDLGTYFYAVLA